MSLLIDRIEKENRIREQSEPYIDAFIGLSGVYSLSSHFHYEAGRGVDEISPMKPAGGFTRELLNYYSPTWRMKNKQHPGAAESTNIPKILLIHGMDDDTAPFTSTSDLYFTLKEKSNSSNIDISQFIMEKTGHVETLTELIFGGKSKDIIINWIND